MTRCNIIEERDSSGTYIITITVNEINDVDYCIDNRNIIYNLARDCVICRESKEPYIYTWTEEVCAQDILVKK